MKNNVFTNLKVRSHRWLAISTAVLACTAALSVKAETKDEEIARLKARIKELQSEVAKAKTTKPAASKTVKSGQSSHELATPAIVASVVKGGPVSQEVQDALQKKAEQLNIKSAADPKAVNEFNDAMLKAVEESSKLGSSTMPKVFLIHRNAVPATTTTASGLFEKSDYGTGNLLGLTQGDRAKEHTHVFSSILSSLHLRESLDNSKPFQMTVSPEVLKNGGTLADAVFAVDNPDAQDKESDFATFNYTNNRLTHAEGWKAKGVLYLPMAMASTDGRIMSPLNYLPLMGNSSWAIFYPAFRFERDTSKDNTPAPINTLDLLLGADFNFYGNNPADATAENYKADWDNFNFVIHAAAGAHTTFAFDKIEPLWELTATPVAHAGGMNLNAYNQNPHGDAATNGMLLHKVIARLTGTATKNVQDTMDGKKGDSAMPIGYDIGFAIRPETDNRFWSKTEFKAHYEGQWDTQKSNAYHHLFTASLTLPTVGSETSDAGFAISYRRGDDLTSFEKVDEIDVSLKVRF